MTATDLVCEFMPGAGPFDVAGDFYLNLPGSGRASTPDHASLDITGDLSGALELAAPVGNPSTGVGYEVWSKYASAGNQRSWHLRFNTAGGMTLFWSSDGTAVLAASSTVGLTRPPVGSLSVGWWLDVDNGAGGRTITFYARAGDLAGLLANLGTSVLGSAVVQSGTTSVFASTAPMEIGDLSGSSDPPYVGKVREAQLRSGNLATGTTVANPDFSAQSPGTTSFSDGAGRTWTVTSPAAIVGFDWVDLSDRLLYAPWTYGRGNELQTFEPGECDLVLKNDDRNLDPGYTAGTWFGKLNPRVPFRLRSISVALDLPASSGAHATTPDHSSFNVTDLDVRVHLAMDDWSPGGFGQVIASQWGSAGNQAWLLAPISTGVLRLNFTSNGSTAFTRDSTVATGFVDGTDHWVRVTLDVDNGAGGHDVRFYTSDDGVEWTQLGTTVTTGGTTSIFNSTAALAVGDVLPLGGQVRYVEARNGINGTIVADPEFDAQEPGTTSFEDRSGRTWTINGAATIELDTTHETDEFYGFVESGWIQDHRPPAMSNCELHLVDLQAVINGAKLPQTAYEVEVLDDNPLALWSLDETSGAAMADSSGNGFHGNLDNGVLGVEPLVFGGGKAFEIPHKGDNRGIFKGEGLPTGPPCTVEAWIRTAREPVNLDDPKMIVQVQRDSARGSWMSLGIGDVGSSPNGELVIDFAGLGGFLLARGHTRVDDDVRHHVVVTMASTAAADIELYVDGTLQTKTVIDGTAGGTWTSHLWWTIGNIADHALVDFGLDGVADEVAIYNFALTPDRVTAHFQAGANAFDDDHAGDRVDRVLDVLGVPDSMRDIATGDTTVGPADYAGQAAGPYLDSVVESEQGYLYVNHRNAGKITFRGRYSRLTTARSMAPLWTFTDADAIGALHYERGIRVDPNSVKGVVNVVDVTWQGGTIQPSDAASVAAYGPQYRSIRTEAPTAEAGASAGNWVINNYAQPQARVRGFSLNPAADRRLRRAARDLRISDRIATVRHPQTVGAATTSELYVERLTHTYENGVGITTDVNTSAANLGDWWIWGTSAWGIDNNWG